MNFEGYENKAARNLSKHRVSFEEAKTVFDDSLYVDFYDPDHSDDEERYLSAITLTRVNPSRSRISPSAAPQK